MCLWLKPDSTIEVAKEDIPVFKVLKQHSKDLYTSPFYRMYWKKGQTQRVRFFTNDCGSFYRSQKALQECSTVDCGLHSMATHSAAKMKLADILFNKDMRVMKCTIPKGTYFIRGQANEIVSLALRLGS